jgi:hypothetical protein
VLGLAVEIIKVAISSTWIFNVICGGFLVFSEFRKDER